MSVRSACTARVISPMTHARALHRYISMSSMCIRIICVNGKAAAGDGGWGKAVEMASKAFEASKKMRNKTIRKCLRKVNIR